MRLINFGSVNIDHMYQLSHLVRRGETIASTHYQKNAGGKGFNQAVALAKAGQKVYFAGAIGYDGLFLRDALNDYGVDTTCLKVLDVPTGHAMIQVDRNGNNSIILYGGANHCITDEMIGKVLSRFERGDVLLLQNEINCGDKLIREASKRGLCVVLNPSPITPELKTWPLKGVSWFILNEIEAEDLTGQKEPEKMLDELLRRYPDSQTVLTLGNKGAFYASAKQRVYQASVPVKTVDSTAAGDTFTGYFLHAVFSGESVETALKRAAHAAAITVGSSGAACSIPAMEQVLTAVG